MSSAEGKEEEGEVTSDPAGACVVCGSSRVVQRKCKIICLNCGYTRDCTDP